jgi:hypothetical protein
MNLDDVISATGDLLSVMGDYPNTRMGIGVTNRDKQIMTWMLANGTTIQMYINPESLNIAESKQINSTRTKGGFIIQYWGDNLTKLTLSGTTGSSGIKGINVLRDIYHSENRLFESVVGAQNNEFLNALSSGNFTESFLGQGLVPYVAEQLRNKNFVLRPSLASLALGITLFYQGVEYRGFFTNMGVVEDVAKLGLFTYTIEFTATEIHGKRKNFMAWHREPIADDPAGQAVNAVVSAIGNYLTNMMKQATPQTFHPENAPLTFGGNSLPSLLGMPQDLSATSEQL